MKNLILKIPVFVFILCVFSPVIALVTARTFDLSLSDLLFDSLLILRILVYAVWYLGMTDYFENQERNKNILTTLIISVTVGIFISTYLVSHWWIDVLLILVHIAISILLSSSIKKVFYARSKWFIIIETLVTPIGILTLTPEVKRWKKDQSE